MDKIRYTARDCQDQNRTDAFLNESRIGVLGLSDSPFPYVVPVNFIWYQNAIYFHGMGSGKKNNLLVENDKVSFTVYKEIGTVKDPAPCHADTSYFSVMIFGTAQKVTDFSEAAKVLNVLVEKYMPGYYQGDPVKANQVEKYRSGMDQNPVSVYRIKPHLITAKENTVTNEDLFNPS